MRTYHASAFGFAKRALNASGRPATFFISKGNTTFGLPFSYSVATVLPSRFIHVGKSTLAVTSKKRLPPLCRSPGREELVGTKPFVRLGEPGTSGAPAMHGCGNKPNVTTPRPCTELAQGS